MSFHENNNGQLRAKDLCFIDIETTGSVLGYHEIIEIAAVRTLPDSSCIRGIWHANIMPKHPERVSAYAKELNGFSVERWNLARESNPALWKEFADFSANCVPVCHNPSFDRGFITLAATSEGLSDIKLDYHWLGTESLAWPLYRHGFFSKLSLANLCDYLEVEREPIPHNAIDGAQACRRVYTELIKRFSAAISYVPTYSNHSSNSQKHSMLFE